MSVLPLCVEPHPVLRRKARPITAFTAEVKRLACDLIDTMYANEGVGLAAPQVGEDLQLFVANPSLERGRELIIANPILEAGRGRTGMVEGCLSVPNVWEKVRRAARVRMRGRDVTGAVVEIEADGLLAIVLQHEFDHLQGQLFIDHLSWFRRRRAQARMKSSASSSSSRQGPRRTHRASHEMSQRVVGCAAQ